MELAGILSFLLLPSLSTGICEFSRVYHTNMSNLVTDYTMKLLRLNMGGAIMAQSPLLTNELIDSPLFRSAALSTNLLLKTILEAPVESLGT